MESGRTISGSRTHAEKRISSTEKLGLGGLCPLPTPAPYPLDWALKRFGLAAKHDEVARTET